MRPETVWLLIFFYISENRLNGLENGETQLFNSEGVVKWAYFQKKWSIPLKRHFCVLYLSLMIIICILWYCEPYRSN